MNGSKLELTLALDTTKKQRPKWSKKRYDTFERLRLAVASQYKHAVDTYEPITVTFKRLLAEIQAADVTATQRKTLIDSLWATREFVVVTYSRWQLYLETPESVCYLPTMKTLVKHQGRFWTPLTSSEISALREAGDEHVWDRVHGLMEWHDVHKPFYEDSSPALVTSKQ